MINLKLGQILAFVAVAEARGFRPAADRLSLSQSAVSARVRQLEEALGVRLFDRTTRSVALTPEGERLLGAARQALGDLQQLAEQLRAEASLQRGRVSVTALPSVAATILPPAVQDFAQHHPRIFVGVVDCAADRALNLVLTGDADFAMTNLGNLRRDLAFEPLFRDECLVVVPLGHPLADRDSVDLHTVAEHRLLLPVRGAGFRETIDAAFAAAGLQPPYEREAANLATLMRFAEIGMGVSFVPAIFASKLDLSRCRTLPLRPSAMWRDIGLVTRRGVSLSPAARAFAAFLRSRFAEKTGKSEAVIPS
jgi:LysR family transcriptional regulator, carnitine catabolism transcriptional activator